MQFFYFISAFGHSGSSITKTKQALLPKEATNPAIEAIIEVINDILNTSSLLFYV